MENPLQKEIRIKRNKEIVELYPTLTLKEIATKYGLTPEGVRYIIKKVKGEKATSTAEKK